MNESILRALMRMFAIIANADASTVSDEARKVVKSYLDVMLDKEHTEMYLQLFDDYVKIHHHVKKSDTEKVQKQTSLNSVKVLKICSEINEELHQKEKIVVLVRLLEFVNVNGDVTEKEMDFVKTVSDIFNIPSQEFEELNDLNLNNEERLKQNTKFLQISKSDDDKLPYKHFISDVAGKINILHIESTNTFLLKYTGSESYFLNNQNITPGRIYVFDNGAVVKGPKIKPVYYSDIAGKYIHAEDQAKVFLKAENIEFYYKNTGNGIHKFSFEEQSGRMLGIMGGSGVGKSTLLNILNGTFPLHGGKISINGYDIHKEKDKLNGIIGFVPQDDLLIEELTVYQNLYYNAKLCFGNFNEQQIKEAVEKVLNDLDLSPTKDLKVGSPTNKFISGGQRKRLNIALELIREPSILIVDEPTSGLSSMDSDMVMNLLKQQSLKGKLVLINIHQPSSDIYKLFDSLLMMDKGGHPVYYGNPVDALSYFKRSANYVNPEETGCPECGNVNTEQPLQILEARMVDEFGKYTKDRKVSPKEWYTKFKNEIEPEHVKSMTETKVEKLPPNFFKTPSGFRQFLIFTARNIRSKLTNKQFLIITFLEAPVLAIILGYFSKYISGTDADPNAYVFAENINLAAYLFMAVTVALFFGMTLSAEEIIKDAKILKREKFLNLSKFSYLNSKIIVLFIISAIQTMSFILVGNWILEIHGMTLTYWLILFSAAAFANILGLIISSGFDSVVTIYITIPFILVPQLLFSGVIVDFTKLHKDFTSYKVVPVIGDLMTSRWAYEALAVAQFKYNRFERSYFDVETEKSRNNYTLSFLIPELENYANTIEENTKNGSNKEQTDRYYTILKNEMEKMNLSSDETFDTENLLNPKAFIPEGKNKLMEFLAKQKKIHNKLQYQINLRYDSVSNVLIKTYGSREAVVKLKNDHHNKKMEEILKNKTEFDAIKEENNQLVQVTDPIFKEPESRNGRAHFYSPVKYIGSLRIDTVWFNIGFIWLTSLITYLLLIFDGFRRFIDLFSKKEIR
jgi:ABC-type multidrug transport system ATPase subunit